MDNHNGGLDPETPFEYWLRALIKFILFWVMWRESRTVQPKEERATQPLNKE